MLSHFGFAFVKMNLNILPEESVGVKTRREKPAAHYFSSSSSPARCKGCDQALLYYANGIFTLSPLQTHLFLICGASPCMPHTTC